MTQKKLLYLIREQVTNLVAGYNRLSAYANGFLVTAPIENIRYSLDIVGDQEWSEKVAAAAGMMNLNLVPLRRVNDLGEIYSSPEVLKQIVDTKGATSGTVCELILASPRGFGIFSTQGSGIVKPKIELVRTVEEEALSVEVQKILGEIRGKWKENVLSRPTF